MNTMNKAKDGKDREKFGDTDLAVFIVSKDNRKTDGEESQTVDQIKGKYDSYIHKHEV
ncbi:hypothetical protein [Vibrio sp. 1CM24A]|uniref:hypothetical protein n=1 Tax=Vibrio sp. 1CM24A TaxID=2929165 RepID=UPI0020C0E9EE|nr:hypothetical protein [Vibrio sp. 1CM24A]MCK8079275.1 hypothetical protein [Vibrio sp. 1CM24A]